MTYTYSTDIGGEIAGFLIIYLIFYLLMFGLSIASYVLSSLGTYTIAKRRGLNHPWMAWVPVLSSWLLGSISDQYQYVTNGKIKNKRKWLVGLECAVIVVFIVFYVVMIGMTVNTALDTDMTASDSVGAAFGFLGTFLLMWLLVMGVSIAQMVIRYIALHDLYKSCDPNNSTLFLILSIVVSVTEPFFIFACRKKDRGMPPRKPQPSGYYIPEQQGYGPAAPGYPPQPPVYQPPEAPTYRPPVYQPPVYQPEPPAYHPTEDLGYPPAADAAPEAPENSPAPAQEPVTPVEEVVTPEEEPVVPVEEPAAPAQEPVIPAAEPVEAEQEVPEAPQSQDPWDAE